ncbi:MAG: 6-bladed beta-propeller [Bacteroidales bacterium]|jgi:hypothetical protein|nr:6-bladed beta-propeller [Bacteroidales bacterium]
MKQYIIIPLLLLLLLSCSERKQYDFSEIPERALRSEILFEESDRIFIGNTHMFCAVDSFIFILDKYEDKNFTLINTKNGNTARICPVGQGPGEIINPSPFVNIINRDGSGLSLAIYDISYSKLFVYNLDSILVNDNTKAFETVSLVPGSLEKGGIHTHIQILNDSLWIGSGIYLDGVFSFFKDGIRQREIVDLFINDPFVSKFQQALRDANVFKTSRNKLQLVRSSQNGGLIEAYSIDEDTLKNNFSHKYFKPEYAVNNNGYLVSSNGSRYGYIDVCISSDRAFGLYSGKKIQESDSFQSRFVHVYDFTGELLEILVLDRPVCAIDVSMNEDTLYAIDASGERKIVAFKL